MAFNKTDLDKGIGQTCHVPGCTEKHHEFFILAQRCHRGHGSRVKIGGGLMTVLCHVCGLMCAEVEIEDMSDDCVHALCHPEAPLEAQYHRNGIVRVVCHECDQPIQEFEVSDSDTAIPQDEGA